VTGKKKPLAASPPEGQAAAGEYDPHAMCRAIIGTTSDGFHLLDAQSRILEVNDAYVKRSGYTREELLAMSITDLDALERPEETAARIAKVIGSGGDVFETRHRAKDGTIWHVEISVTYWSFDGGRFVCFLRDITERKRAEIALRQSETTYRGILDSLDEAVYILDEHGTFIDVNRGAERKYGYTRDELVGMTPALVSAAGRNDLGKVMEQCLLAYHGQPQSF